MLTSRTACASRKPDKAKCQYMVATARRALEEAPTRVWETRLGARRTASAKRAGGAAWRRATIECRSKSARAIFWTSWIYSVGSLTQQAFATTYVSHQQPTDTYSLAEDSAALCGAQLCVAGGFTAPSSLAGLHCPNFYIWEPLAIRSEPYVSGDVVF